MGKARPQSRSHSAKKEIARRPRLTKKDIDTPRRKRRNHPGTVVKREIKRLQKSVEYCLKKAPFRRLCAEIGSEIKEDLYMREDAKLALQDAAEDFIIDYLGAGYVVAEQSSRKPVITLTPRHTRTANNVALRFPGKAIDFSFQERRDAMRAQPRTTPKIKKERKHRDGDEKRRVKKEKKTGEKKIDDITPSSSDSTTY